MKTFYLVTLVFCFTTLSSHAISAEDSVQAVEPGFLQSLNSNKLNARGAPGTLNTYGFEASEGFTTGFLEGQVGWTVLSTGSMTQPIIDNSDPASGAQHIQLGQDSSLPVGTYIGALSPDLGPQPAGNESRVSVDIKITTSTGMGANYLVAAQAPSTGQGTWNISFNPIGYIVVFDNTSGAYEYIMTDTTWPTDTYFNLEVITNADGVPGIDYYLNGTLFYSQVTMLYTDKVEQIIMYSNNDNSGEVANFDNLIVDNNYGGGGPVDVSAKTAGLWTVDGVNNQGVSIEILNDDRVVMYARVNHNGDDMWLFGYGDFNDNMVDVVDVYQATGANFGDDFNADDVQIEAIGSAIMTLSACHQAELLVDIEGINTNSYLLTKTVEVVGNECGNNTKALPNGISGSWFDPSRNGEGFSVIMFEDNNETKAHVSWYTYDQGQHLTLIGIAEVNGQTLTVDELKSFSGADFLSGTSQATTRGQLNMTWDKCRTAEVEYDLSESGLDSGTMDLVQLSILKDTDCGDLSK